MSRDLVPRSLLADDPSYGGLTDAPELDYEGAHMKARMYQLFTVMALFAVLIDPVLNGVKW